MTSDAGHRTALDRVCVLVTGSTSGLGAAMAAALVDAGARAMVTSRDLDVPDEVLARLQDPAVMGRPIVGLA